MSPHRWLLQFAVLLLCGFGPTLLEASLLQQEELLHFKCKNPGQFALTFGKLIFPINKVLHVIQGDNNFQNFRRRTRPWHDRLRSGCLNAK